MVKYVVKKDDKVVGEYMDAIFPTPTRIIKVGVKNYEVISVDKIPIKSGKKITGYDNIVNVKAAKK